MLKFGIFINKKIIFFLNFFFLLLYYIFHNYNPKHPYTIEFLKQLDEQVLDEDKKKHFLTYFFNPTNTRRHKFHIVSPSP